jgi:hypothetical protein
VKSVEASFSHARLISSSFDNAPLEILLVVRATYNDDRQPALGLQRTPGRQVW